MTRTTSRAVRGKSVNIYTTRGSIYNYVGTLPFPIIDYQTGRVQCKFLCLYVIVNIANEDKKLQTPADIIPLYARKIQSISVERKYPFFTLKLDFDVA